jgi:DNA invertase Pin-like site-specific DNA recombinase
MEVFTDIERYRIGKKLVEPSGTRSDRPGLRAMLAGAVAGRFEVIIAWREDRLYRGYRPMLDVLDMLDATGIDIELVKETFDKRLAPVKAWAARMELDAKHDRFMMGVAARLAEGKAWNHVPPYGYNKTGDGEYEIDPNEAPWVQKLFRWYADDVPLAEIRRRFIAGGAPQRKKVKRPWHLATLRKYLRAEHYWTGVHVTKWDGKEYEIAIPPLVMESEAARVQARKAKYKLYPAGNSTHENLAPGLVYCAACGTKCRSLRIHNGYRRKDGTVKLWDIYWCGTHSNRTHEPGCVKRMGAKQIDRQVWEAVCSLLLEPGRLEKAVQNRVEQLQAEEEQAETDIAELQGRLDDMLSERQRVITWALEGKITEADMELRLASLTLTQKVLESKLSDTRLLTGYRANQLMEMVQTFKEEVREGLRVIESEPETEEERLVQVEARRNIISSLVQSVQIDERRRARVTFSFDLTEGREVGESIVHNQYTEFTDSYWIELVVGPGA